MELFGVAIVVLLVGITLLVLVRSKDVGRTPRAGTGRREPGTGSPSRRDHTAGRR